MRIRFPSRKWKLKPDSAEKVRELLLAGGGIEDKEIKSTFEAWRVKCSDATITYYTSGTLFCTETIDPAVKEICDSIAALAQTAFILPTRDFLIGFDETGKGEVLGHTVLAGVIFPRGIFKDVEDLIGVADTKKKRTVGYWDDALKRIDTLKAKGLDFLIDKIPPWHIDRFNLNKIMDVVYQRILSNFMRRIEAPRVRIIFDDYGVGDTLKRYIRSLENAGAEIIVTHSADSSYLEAKLASVVAKREREKVMEAINNSAEFKLEGCSLGSGNAGDPDTLNWLKRWKETSKPWPWFVKRSFKTVRELDKQTSEAHKIAPPIREGILSEEFRKEFEAGRFSITTVSIVCPSCGERSKAALITTDSNKTVGRCISCKKEIPDLGLTLRYYCGYLLPDSNIIKGTILSKDLEKSRFFEGFTVVLSPVVKYECDSPAGKKELERLARFAAIGRIRLEDVRQSPVFAVFGRLSSLERDEAIKQDALSTNAILVTGDNSLKAYAQSAGLFSLHV